MAVFVLDKRKQALMSCSEKRARLLLSRRLAVVHRTYPFTIRLKQRVGGEAVRATGSFNITTSTDTVQGISHKYCILISRNDGYGYSLTQQQGGAIPPTTSASGKLGYPRER